MFVAKKSSSKILVGAEYVRCLLRPECIFHATNVFLNIKNVFDVLERVRDERILRNMLWFSIIFTLKQNFSNCKTSLNHFSLKTSNQNSFKFEHSTQMQISTQQYGGERIFL